MEQERLSKQIGEGIARFLASKDARLEFYIDENSGDVKARVIRNRLDLVIMDIPGSDFLQLLNQ